MAKNENKEIVQVLEAKSPQYQQENDSNEVKRYLNVTPSEGLSSAQVEKRKSQGLVNVTKNENGKTIIGIICSNVFTFFNLVFLILTILLCLVGSFRNLMFLTTVIPNLVIGIIQEIRAKIMIEKLSLMSAPTTTVVRDGKEVVIAVNELVLDDVMVLKNGKQICNT